MSNFRKRYNNQINVSGKKLKQFREEKNFTQEQLSNKLLLDFAVDLSATSISNIERSMRAIVDYELYALSQVLNKNMNDFIDM